MELWPCFSKRMSTFISAKAGQLERTKISSQSAHNLRAGLRWRGEKNGDNVDRCEKRQMRGRENNQIKTVSEREREGGTEKSEIRVGVVPVVILRGFPL